MLELLCTTINHIIIAFCYMYGTNNVTQEHKCFGIPIYAINETISKSSKRGKICHRNSTEMTWRVQLDAYLTFWFYYLVIYTSDMNCEINCDELKCQRTIKMYI